VPHITESLYLMGAEIIFSPCAWAIEPGGEARNIRWIGNIYRQRTRGKRLYIVSANGVGRVTQGPWRGKILQGNSLVFGPGGHKLLQGPTNQADLLMCTLAA
jgi:predicted amidohydrolase